MSARNGDRSRFHRLRKARQARRIKLRALRVELVATGVVVNPPVLKVA